MDNYYTLPIAIVLGDDYIITTILKHHALINRIKALPDNQNENSLYTWLMRVFLIISKDYINHLKSIKEKILAIEHLVITTTDNTGLYDLIGINKGLIFYEAAIQGNTRILKIIETRAEKQGFNQDEMDMLRDVQVEHFQAMTLIMKYKEMIEKMTNMLSTVINNNMNVVMKRLTAWTILLTIPTVTSAIWGMNVDLPFADHNMGFWIVLLLTGIITYITYRWLRGTRNM